MKAKKLYSLIEDGKYNAFDAAVRGEDGTYEDSFEALGRRHGQSPKGYKVPHPDLRRDKPRRRTIARPLQPLFRKHTRKQRRGIQRN